MTLQDWLSHARALWLVAAVVLGLAELAVPGVFLIFLAIAAAITGAAMLALPALPIAVQLGSFAVWSVVSVLIGERWYVDYPVGTSDPLLNDRGARMVGQIVTVEESIAGDSGRVHIGDGSWPARGFDTAAGTQVRIVAIDRGTIVVEPIESAEAP